MVQVWNFVCSPLLVEAHFCYWCLNRYVQTWLWHIRRGEGRLWGSLHRTLDLKAIWIGDPEFKDHFASTRPQWDPSWALCCMTVREIQSSSAMCVVCVPCGLWSSRATTLNPDRDSESSESVFSARVESPHIFWFSCCASTSQDTQVCCRPIVCILHLILYRFPYRCAETHTQDHFTCRCVMVCYVLLNSPISKEKRPGSGRGLSCEEAMICLISWTKY